MPEAILLQTYRVLGHALDLQRDIGHGDTFRLAYETFDNRLTEGLQQSNLLYVSLRLRERTLSIYRHTTPDGYVGYFDTEGRSAERPLLKTPVDDGRLSSRFGMRHHPILGYSRMHEGLDFSAPRGAPVLAAGNGIVVRRSRYGSFGRYIKILHGGSYATAYAHLSGYAKGLKPGDHLRQGAIIGYVGASGLATGPHLHYEVLRDDEPVDPVEVSLPPRRVLAGEELSHFRVARIKLLVIIKRARIASGTERAFAVN